MDLGAAGSQPWNLFTGLVGTLLLPALLLAGSIGCLRMVPLARVALMLYAWAAIAAYVLLPARDVWQMRSELVDVLDRAVGTAHQLILPILLLVFLRRPEIKSVFVLVAPGSGFEPTLAGETRAATPHR
jgi:hypothetical protein